MHVYLTTLGGVDRQSFKLLALLESSRSKVEPK